MSSKLDKNSTKQSAYKNLSTGTSKTVEYRPSISVDDSVKNREKLTEPSTQGRPYVSKIT